MELDALINEICSKVKERVAALETGSGEAGGCQEEKPGLLILTQRHGETCHPVLENPELRECYRMDCALLLDESCEVSEYEGVIAYTLTNDALGKIANGIFDTEYSRKFGTALLLGKQIFVPEEEVELFRYRDTAPKGYYARLEENLRFLEKNGVTVLPGESLVEAILGRKPCRKAEAAKDAPTNNQVATLSKRVITERDLIEAREKKVGCVLLPPTSIVTDLAKDYAKRHHITLKREGA